MERTMVALGPASRPDAHADSARANTSIGFGRFLTLTLQLGLILGTAWMYRVELERGFGVVGLLILCGFVIHAWLPARARLPFFLLLTTTAVGVLLRGDGLWLAGLGLGLIGLCHIPIPWWTRVFLISAVGGTLAAMQAGWLAVPWAAAVIPVLAAMFMFRLIVYLYDLKGEKTPASPLQRVAYFFLLPNVCFPLFPVIDFKTFIRGYYDAPAPEIYQKGLYWMLRGVGHLLLYRLVYHLLPTADSNVSVVGVFAFMVMSYALLLRVSGLFHFIAGILCLFGFNLPPTFNHYFLASSFTDLWRRMNIYYKDFMMTVVFNPIFLAIRRWGVERRIVLATACVFVVTWFLHSYQWFWLQGVFPVTDRDIVFWGFLGAAVAATSIWEVRHGRRRKLQTQSWSWREALGLTVRTVGVFFVMSVFWSLWYSDSLLEWGYRLLRVQESTLRDWALFGGLMAAIVGLGFVGRWLEIRDSGLSRIERIVRENAHAFVPCVAIGLLLLGTPSVHERLGPQVTRVVSKARSTALNTLDANRQERGYYETLSRSTQLGPNIATFEEDFAGFRNSPAVRPTGDLRGYELVPDFRMAFKGTEFRTNRWGHYDRDYEKVKSPGTYRIAVLGGSYAMGWGVEREQTFENIVEDRLNREFVGQGYEKYEILNFAVSGHNVLQALYVAEHGVAEFDPDAVVYVVHNNEMTRLIERLQLMLKLGAQLDDEYLPVQQAVQETRSHAYLPTNEFARRLEPYRDGILRWAYGRMVEASHETGAVPVFAMIRMTSRDFESQEISQLTGMAREAGGVVLHPVGLFDGYELKEIQLSKGDTHPSVRGHQLIADGLYDVLVENAEPIGMAAGAPTSSTAPRR